VSFVHGKGSVFSLDDSGGTLRTLTSYVDDCTGLPGARDLSEVTAFGDSGEKNIPGLQRVSFSIKGSWDSTATTGPHAVLNSLRAAANTATFEYGPEGSTAGKIKLTGECWLSDYTVDASVAEKVAYSASFKVDGTVTSTLY
jgi:hypothetical protein